MRRALLGRKANFNPDQPACRPVIPTADSGPTAGAVPRVRTSLARAATEDPRRFESAAGRSPLNLGKRRAWQSLKQMLKTRLLAFAHLIPIGAPAQAPTSLLRGSSEPMKRKRNRRRLAWPN